MHLPKRTTTPYKPDDKEKKTKNTKQQNSDVSQKCFIPEQKHQTKNSAEKTQALQQRLQRNISPKASKTGQSGQSPLGPLPTSRAASPDPEVPRKHPQKNGDFWGRWFSFVLCFFLDSMLIFRGVKLEMFFKFHEMTDSCCWSTYSLKSSLI